MKNRRIKIMYRFEIISVFIGFFSGIIGLIFMTIFNFQILSIKNWGVFLLCTFVIGFALLIILSTKEMIPLLRDYNDYKNGKYFETKGRVIGFQSNRDPESGVQINSKPVIQTDNGIIVLKVNINLRIGETYYFKYLRYSKLAEIEKETGDGGVS